MLHALRLRASTRFFLRVPPGHMPYLGDTQARAWPATPHAHTRSPFANPRACFKSLLLQCQRPGVCRWRDVLALVRALLPMHPSAAAARVAASTAWHVLGRLAQAEAPRDDASTACAFIDQRRGKHTEIGGAVCARLLAVTKRARTAGPCAPCLPPCHAHLKPCAHQPWDFGAQRVAVRVHARWVHTSCVHDLGCCCSATASLPSPPAAPGAGDE